MTVGHREDFVLSCVFPSSLGSKYSYLPHPPRFRPDLSTPARRLFVRGTVPPSIDQTSTDLSRSLFFVLLSVDLIFLSLFLYITVPFALVRKDLPSLCVKEIHSRPRSTGFLLSYLGKKPQPESNLMSHRVYRPKNS